MVAKCTVHMHITAEFKTYWLICLDVPWHKSCIAFHGFAQLRVVTASRNTLLVKLKKEILVNKLFRWSTIHHIKFV